MSTKDIPVLQPQILNGALNELIRKSDSVDKKLQMRELAERAQRQWASFQQQQQHHVQAAGGTSTVAFPTQSVFHVLLLGLYTKKPKLCVNCLGCIRHLVVTRTLPPSESFNSLIQSGVLSLGGKSILWALLERLADTMNVTEILVKEAVLACIEEMMKDDKLPITGASLLKPFQTVFNLHLTTMNVDLKDRTKALLHLVVSRVLRAFSTRDRCPTDRPVVPAPTFSMEDDLGTRDYEVEPSEYFPVDVGCVLGPRKASEHSALFNECDAVTRDVVLVLRTCCTIGVRPLPPTANTTQHVEVKTREAALSLLCFFFENLPADLPWLSKIHYDSTNNVVQLIKKDLWVAIGYNMCTVAPGSFFGHAIVVLKEVCLKWHYFYQTEIYVFLTSTLFPLAKHRASSYQQKVCILSLVKAVLSDPSTVVSYFINYDCNVEFGDVRRLDGMLDPMSTFVVELMYLNFEGKGNGMLSADQQRLLREECLSVMHVFSASVFRWVSEFPPASAISVGGTMTSCLSDEEEGDDEDVDGASSFGGIRGGSADDAPVIQFVETWRESMENDAAKDQPLGFSPDNGSFNVVSPGTSFGVGSVGSGIGQSDRNPSFATDLSRQPSATFSRRSRLGKLTAEHSAYFESAGYHWTHVHQMYCNKKITGEGVARFNTNWRHGRTYLIDKKVLTEGNHLQFAMWIRKTGSVHTDQICKIFERILKDQECASILKAYLSTLHYKNVPVDVAFRDTTVEFSNFDGATVQFEAQVWEKVQVAFGAEYALQNDYSLSSADAETLCGCILFLHTSLHNHKVGSSDRMSEASFVSLASECVNKAVSDQELSKTYRRVLEKRWGPETNLRGTVTSFLEPVIARGSPHGTPTTKNPPTAGGNEGAASSTTATATQLIQPQEPTTLNLSREDSSLLANMPQYSTNLANLSADQVAQLQFLQVVNERLRIFEQNLMEVNKRRTRVLKHQYIKPVFAQHGKLILQRFFPHWVATAYLGLRQQHQMLPAMQQIEEVYQAAFDTAAAFGLRLSDQFTTAEKLIQRCLRQNGSVVLSEEQAGGPSSTLGLFLSRKV